MTFIVVKNLWQNIKIRFHYISMFNIFFSFLKLGLRNFKEPVFKYYDGIIFRCSDWLCYSLCTVAMNRFKYKYSRHFWWWDRCCMHNYHNDTFTSTTFVSSHLNVWGVSLSFGGACQGFMLKTEVTNLFFRLYSLLLWYTR